jgi:hypothetical protein
MTGTPHNTFAKDLLGTLLQPLDKVEIDLEAITDQSTLKVHFIPAETSPDDQTLKLVRKCAAQGAAFEAFQSPIDNLEYCCTMRRIFNVHAEVADKALLANQRRPKTNDLPRLWIITPTWSEQNIKNTNSQCSEEWGQGIYLSADIFRTGVIVADRLPKTPDTVWFRMLGQGTIQQEAIDEIAALSPNNPDRQKVLELFMSIKHNSETRLDFD